MPDHCIEQTYDNPGDRVNRYVPDPDTTKHIRHILRLNPDNWELLRMELKELAEVLEDATQLVVAVLRALVAAAGKDTEPLEVYHIVGFASSNDKWPDTSWVDIGNSDCSRLDGFDK